MRKYHVGVDGWGRGGVRSVWARNRGLTNENGYKELLYLQAEKNEVLPFPNEQETFETFLCSICLLV